MGIISSTGLTGFSVYVSDAGGGSGADFFFNNLALLDAPTTDADSDSLPDWWELGFFGNTTSQVGNGDADNDGLDNLAEFNAGAIPNVADTDGDGRSDGTEVTSGTNPLKFNYPTVTLAFSFQDFTAAPTNNPSNLMLPVSGDEFGRQLLVNFPLKVPSFKYKVTAGGWGTNWGAVSANQFASTNLTAGRLGGEDISGSIPAIGVYRFYFNTDSLQYSLARASFSDFPSFATVYGLETTSDLEDPDTDGLTNEQERVAGTHPTISDTDDDGLTDGEEVNGDFSFYNPLFPNPVPLAERSNPLVSDSDGDGLPDGWEVLFGLDPMDSGLIVSGYKNYTGLTVSSNPNGATANPDGDSGGNPIVAFTNLDEFNGGSSPIDATSIPAFRSVSFAVDMRAQMLKGSFNRTNQGVELRGSFNEWAGGQSLLESSTNGIFTNTFTIKGASNTVVGYKFFLTDTNTLANNIYEAGNDRSLTLGVSGQALTAPLVLFGDEQARTVTFAVNMGVLTTLGRFNTNTDTVSVVGPAVGGWGADQRKILTNSGSGLFSGDVVVSGNEGVTNDYKFIIGTGWYEDLGSEVVGTGTNAVTNQITRKLVLGANLSNQIAATSAPFFNNDSEVRPVHFAVNMNVQTNTNKLSFKLDGADRVEVRYGPAFDGGLVLTNNGSGIFVGTYPVSGQAGTTKPFKYVALSVTASNTNAVWERVDVPRTNELANRTFVLGPTNTPQTVHSAASPAFFSNDDGVGPVITLTGASTINLNLGDSYVEQGATATDVIDGSVAVTPSGTVDTTTAGTYTITYNASDTAGNAAAPVTRTVVVAAASGYATAYVGKNPDAIAPNGWTYLVNYAFGGSDNTAPILPALDNSDPTKLQLVYVVRTDDPTALARLTFVGQVSGDLSAWGTSGITVSNGSSAGLPPNHARKVVSVDRGSDSRKFLRLRVNQTAATP